MRLSIITINYNGSNSTIKLLESLRGQIDKDFKVIVVDNASSEADFKVLKNYIDIGFSSAVLLRNKENLGFSAGNNVGIRQTLKNGSDCVLLLNNDTTAERDFVACLKPNLGQSGGIFSIPMDEGGKIAYCGKIEWMKPTLRHEYIENKHETKNRYAIGGAMLINRSVFEKIGFLDDKYFLYFEDADFSLRAQRAGFKLNILHGVKVSHQPSTTTKELGVPLLLRYHYRNSLYFNLKNGPWYIKILVWPWSWLIIGKQLLKIGMSNNEKESRSILDGVFDFYKGKMGKI